MEYLSDFENARVVEFIEEKRKEITRALNLILSNQVREPKIFIALDALSNKLLLCLYAEPLESKWLEAFNLGIEKDGKWNISRGTRFLDTQLAKLNRDSPDSQ